ncbi:MAG: ComF family protein [Blastocatellia bacterium]|nr:ComF family protein [Blastocatellia bacterium]
MLKRSADLILSVFFPQPCTTCDRQSFSYENGPACAFCWSQTKIFERDDTVCVKCQALLVGSSADSIPYCRRCDIQSYDKAAAIGIYEHALAATVVSLKTTPQVPRRIKALIPEALARLDLSGRELIIPVPLSARRRHERGFNQAEVIASLVAKLTNCSIDSVSLARRIHTPMHRVGMDMKARELAVKKAFEVKRPKMIAGKSILLVDDVMTSGSTASYCARVLKKAGAAEVNVFTLARAALRQ